MFATCASILVASLTAVESAHATSHGWPNCHDPGVDDYAGGDNRLLGAQFLVPSWACYLHHRHGSHPICGTV